MFWCRASRPEIDGWASLNPNSKEDWSWNGYNRYINKAEDFTPPPQSQIDQFHIPVDESAHGKGGPLSITWSNFIYPITANWVPSWEALGFQAKDQAAGNTHGVTITPSTLHAQGQSRADARDYLKQDRPNLTVLTGHQVTKLLFNGTDANGTTVSGVSFQANAGDAAKTANARKEVIVSAGSINSPKLLQLSGIGPEALLKSLNIEVVKDLPVGYNLQDHISSQMSFEFQGDWETWDKLRNDQGLQSQSLDEWRNSGSGRYTYINEAIGYISGSDLTGGQSGAADFVKSIKTSDLVNQINDRHQLPSAVRNGLKAQLDLQNDWFTQDIGQFEIIMNPWDAKSIGFQVALQHPWSRGTVQIASTDPFSAPNIDPDYYGLDVDAQIHNFAYDWVRKLTAAGPFGQIFTKEASPGGNGDAQATFIKNNAGTEFHPLGTNSMLPEEDGGVVDTELKVYGFKNLRVVDASIMPLQVSAHLMAPTYGVAEKGADIIKQAHVYVPPPPVSSSSSSSSSQTSSTQSSSSSTEEPSSTSSTEPESSANASAGGANKSSDGGLSTGAKIGIGVGVGAGGLALLGLIAALCARRHKQSKVTDTEPRWLNHTAEAFDDDDQLQAPGGLDADGRRPMSTAGSLDTMATSDLRGSYQQPPYQNYH